MQLPQFHPAAWGATSSVGFRATPSPAGTPPASKPLVHFEPAAGSSGHQARGPSRAAQGGTLLPPCAAGRAGGRLDRRASAEAATDHRRRARARGIHLPVCAACYCVRSADPVTAHKCSCWRQSGQQAASVVVRRVARGGPLRRCPWHGIFQHRVIHSYRQHTLTHTNTQYARIFWILLCFS